MAAGKAKSSDQIKSEPFDGCYPCFGGNGIRGYVDEYNQEGTFSIVGRQGALCGNINIASGKFYATEHAVVTTLFNGIDFNWSNYTLEALKLNEYATGAAQPGLSVANADNLTAFFCKLFVECFQFGKFADTRLASAEPVVNNCYIAVCEKFTALYIVAVKVLAVK